MHRPRGLSDERTGAFSAQMPGLHSGQRVQCTDTSHCYGDTAYCDLATHTCVGCVTDQNCPSDKPVCGPGKVCAECKDLEHCGDPDGTLSLTPYTFLSVDHRNCCRPSEPVRSSSRAVS